ncbi:MAG: AtpZ/AtpI family protein [Elusimicrobia bacterium]|nr:AtpZ/AtpI family protein [Elusimicrobiota bacterium]
MQFALTALIGMAAGYWLDQHRYLPSPIGVLGGLFTGAVAGMYLLVRSLK